MISAKSRSKRLIAAAVSLSFLAGCGTSTEATNAKSTSDTELLEEALSSRQDGLLANVPDDAPAFGDSVDDLSGSGQEAPPPVVPEGYELFEWEDLLAPGSSTEADDAKFLERLNELEDGTPEAEALYEEWQASTEAKGELVNTGLNGKKIHMAGFVTPLDFEADVITEFLFVPYFGACVHVPPPPVNQTVMVKLGVDEAMAMEDTWDAVWVTGELTATSATTDLATAGYTITAATTEVAGDDF